MQFTRLRRRYGFEDRKKKSHDWRKYVYSGLFVPIYVGIVKETSDKNYLKVELEWFLEEKNIKRIIFSMKKLTLEKELQH